MKPRKVTVALCVVLVVVGAIAATYFVEERRRHRAAEEVARLRAVQLSQEAIRHERQESELRMQMLRRSPLGRIQDLETRKPMRHQILDAPGPGYREQRASMHPTPPIESVRRIPWTPSR